MNPWFEWRNCQRIEINAIKPRDRVGYLERKISEALRRPAGVGTGEDEADSLPYRPAPEVMQDYATTLLSRSIAAQIQAALERTIDLSRIAADAQSALEPLTLDSDALQAAVAADSQRPWREIVKQAAHEVWNQQTDLMEQIDQSVVRVLRQALAQLPRND